MMNRFIFSKVLTLMLVVTSLQLNAGPGDTTVVQFFTFGSVRDSVVNFPPDNISYEKILMYYTLKCNPAQSPACGEWDYLTYTNLYEHTGVPDSNEHSHPNFIIDGDTPDSLMLMNSPSWKFNWNYQYFNQSVMTDSAVIGSGNQYLQLPLYSNDNDARTMFLWRASELLGANLSGGDLTALRFNFVTLGSDLKNLRIRIKHTSLNSLTPTTVADTGFTEVFNKHTSFTSTGWVKINFTYPFQWDGSSNIIVEFSYSHDLSSNPYTLLSETVSYNGCISSNDQDYCLRFNNQDHVEVPVAFSSSIDSAITVSFWAYGDTATLPKNTYLFEGRDINNHRVVNAHLPWSNGSIYWDAGNTGSSYDRIYKAALPHEYEGRWNHWALTKDVASGVMKIYLNGVLWHSGTGYTKTMEGITSFKIGSNYSASGSYYRGMVDEFRIWNVALDSTDINNWMLKDVGPSHPKYSNLVAYYQFNEGSGITTTDESQFSQTATLVGLPEWQSYEGKYRMKNFDTTNLRPHIIFEKGIYNPANIDSVFVIDSVQTPLVMVTLFEDTVHPNTNIPTDTIYKWLAYYNNYTFDSLGNAVDSALVLPDTVLFKEEHPYWDPPYEVVNTFELGRFITPYGNGLDLGSGFTWVYDVTDFRPLLRDSVHISAGNWQELLDLKFMMIEGTPEREVIDIKKLWSGKFYLNNIDESIAPVTLKLDSAAHMFRVKTTTSGHDFSNSTNCAEFCPKIQSVKVGDSTVASWQILQECADNPLFPQGGTWIYDRAGWCPGAKVTTQNIDISDYVTSGDSATIDYDSETDPYGNYRFKAYLVSYGSPNFYDNASIEDVLAPNSMKFFGRNNPICGRPVVRIKNSGANDLTSLTINYGPDGVNQTYQWTGNLKFTETEVVTLDPLDWANWTGKRRFNISLSNPNGVQDEYTGNDSMSVAFNTPAMMPNLFQIWLRTNMAAFETSYHISDAQGNIIFSRSAGSMVNNTWYKDTFNLATGCYSLTIEDSDDDGIYFWNNNDGSGSISFRLPNAAIIEVLEPDFGKGLTFNFTVGYLLDIDEKESITYFEVFPNPTSGELNIAFALDMLQDVTIEVRDVMGQIIQSREYKNTMDKIVKINLEGERQGFYFCTLRCGSDIKIKKVILAR